MNHASRLRRLRRQMKQRGIESLLVTHLADVRYLCGFTGSNALLAITATRAAMFTDGRYIAQARQETSAARVVIAPKSAREEACRWLAASGAKHCAFDPETTTVADLAVYRKALPPGSRGFFEPLAEPLVRNLRLIKDQDELGLMKQAARLGVDLFHELLPQLEPGLPETTVAALLEQSARTRGAEGMSFETIVASGPRSAFPHGRATAQRLPRKGFLTLDFGVILKGYCSDMTRTVFLGQPTRRERFTYDSVLEAQQAAVAAVKPGVSCGEVDEAARSVLRKAGLAEYFTHSTGHGVGLEIHEAPRIAADQSQSLLPGMVVTIEPGVYIAGQFGVRIEDMVVVTREGGQVLTQASTGWTQL
ncbi:MAG TPA: Xaa-Pro peptidase family protein [Acidobacteriaceae bacterium]|nr:Xaa-Pro peptidase family protein [Acidobacteriaceae bacterium]